MFPLIGLAAQFLPSIIGWAFGDDAEKVTTGVVDAAREVFGTDDPDAIPTAIAKDPALAMQFKAKLLDIQADAQKRAHELAMATLANQREQMTREIEDKASARVAFSQNQGVLVLGMVQVIGFILVAAAVVYGAFAFLIGSVSLQGKDPGTVALIASIISSTLTLLGTMAMQPNGFFYGSSKDAVDGVKQFAQSIKGVAK